MIQRENATPLYLQLKNEIKHNIRNGILKAGEQLPSEAQMKEQYGVSRVTIRNAMAELEAEHYIVKIQGKGSFVAQSEIPRLPIGITSFSEDAKMQGIRLRSRVVECGLHPVSTDVDTEFFNLQKGDSIMMVKRVRYADKVPICIEENHFPCSLRSLEGENLSGSLYEVLETKYHIHPAIKGRRSIRIIFATEEISELLELPLGTPVIESDVCVFDADGAPLHTVRDIVRGDNDRFLKWYV